MFLYSGKDKRIHTSLNDEAVTGRELLTILQAKDRVASFRRSCKICEHFVITPYIALQAFAAHVLSHLEVSQPVVLKIDDDMGNSLFP